MPQEMEEIRNMELIRHAAMKNLHLIFIRDLGGGRYTVVDSPDEGGVPHLTEYISFHRHEAKIRVKDIGLDVIYLLTPAQFRDSLLETRALRDPTLEAKLRVWFPILWGEFGDGDEERYASILRRLGEMAEIYDL